MTGVFDIDLTKPVKNLENLSKLITKVGNQFDTTSEDGRRMADELATQTAQWTGFVKKDLESAIIKFSALTGKNQELYQAMKDLAQYNAVNRFFENLQGQLVTTSIKGEALANTTKGLGLVMKNMESSNIMAKANLQVAVSQDKLRAEIMLTDKALLDGNSVRAKELADKQIILNTNNQIRDNLTSLAQETRKVSAAASDLSTSEARGLATAQATYDVRRHQVNVSTELWKREQMAATNLKMVQSEQYKSVASSEAQVQSIIAVNNAYLQSGNLLSAWGKKGTEAHQQLAEAAQNKEVIKTLQMEATAVTRRVEEGKRLSQQQLEEATEQARLNAEKKLTIATDAKIRDGMARLVQNTRENVATLQQLSQQEAEENRQSRVALEVGRARAEMSSDLSRRQQMAQVQMERMNHTLYQSIVRDEEKAKALEQVIRMEARQEAELMKLNRQMEISTTATAREIEQKKRQLIASREAATIESEHTKVLRQKTNEVSKLAAEVNYLRSAEGQRHLARTNQLKEERKLILEAAEATKKKQRELRTANQLTAAWRATLQGLSSSIGMYTSATILTASAMYATARTFKETISLGREFGFEMAQAQAVMGASVESFSYVEAQVRMLGQTTIFTASEVAKAATELGLAGLSTGQAVMALVPTLDLAAIGNIEMGKSADYATNIMMMYNKEVSDLTDVVDIMATAVTNSNTNIDQLANALTYAGPAAQSAGYSIEETTAAIATLANQGIKASRAGTALRRLFVNLLNPTAKGTAVMEKYNISVTTLDGSARSLTDVLGQLSSSLNNLPGPERLAAVQDLVGVYATSTISALIGANEQFRLMNDQMLVATGNAAKMKEELQRAFEFDVREAKSAFQELQITFFKENEMQFKVWAKTLTNFLQGLNEVVDGDSGLSKIGWYIEKAGTAVKLFMAYKFTSYLVKQSRAWGDLIGDYTRASTSYRTQIALKSAMIQQGVIENTQQRIRSANSKEEYLDVVRNTNAYKQLTLLKAQAAAITGFMPGIVAAAGTAAMAYTLLRDAFFGDKAGEEVTQQENRIKRLRDLYVELASEGQRRSEALNLQALKDQRGATRGLIHDLRSQLNAYGDEMSSILSKGENINELDKERLSYLLAQTNARSHQLIQAQKEHNQISSTLDKEQLRFAQKNKVTAEYNRLLDEQNKLQGSIAALEEQSVRTTSKGRINEINKELGELRTRLKELEPQIQQTGIQLEMLAAAPAGLDKIWQNFNDKVKEQFEESSKGTVNLNTKMAELRARMSEVDSEIHAITGSLIGVNEVSEEMANKLDRLLQTKLKITRAISDTSKEALEDIKDTVRLQSEYEDMRLDSSGKLVKINEMLAVVTAEIAYHEGMLQDDRDQKEYNKALEKRNQLTSQQLSLMKELEKGNKGSKSAARPDRELQDAIKLYEQLHQKIDKVGYAKADHDKKAAQLQLLLNASVEEGGISIQQYEAALAKLKEELFIALSEADEFTKKIQEVFSRYSSDPYKQQTEDISTLTTAMQKGKISAEEYKLAMDKVHRSISEDIKSNAPDIGISLTPNSGLFSEFLKTAVDVAKAEEKWDLFKLKVMEGHQQEALAEQDIFNTKMANLTRQYEEGALLQSEYNRQKEAEEDRHGKAMLALQSKAASASSEITNTQIEFEANSRKMIMASMAGSLSSMLGMIAATGEDATAAQKAAFVAQKALAVAQIILNTHLAASQAQAHGEIWSGMALSTAIMAQGYASAGLVAALSIGELTGGKSTSSNYAGAYDKGGYIPTGKYGIVGEYGPEIVNGPAHVTGREATARKLGGGETYQTIAPVINIDYNTESGESHADQQRSANLLASTIEAVVVKTIAREMRPNGMLNRGSNG